MRDVSTNKTIAKNTAYLYIRMFFTMGVGLYTSRVVLGTLGEIDYGIWNVVGGVIAMFSFLNTSMSGATSRFITYELGKGTQESLKIVFSGVMTIHCVIAFILLILGETIGLWFLNNKLIIPYDKMHAANLVYQAVVASTVLGVIQVPFSALILAYERMNVYAYIEIFNVALKLIIVLLLPIIPNDKLISYGVMSFFVGLLISVLYFIYCRVNFKCTTFSICRNIAFLKPILSFSGWDLYGNASVVARTQGVNILLNMFFTTVMNAASGIATQVQTAIMSFASNVLQAFRPQIIKNYAIGNIETMNALISKASQYTTLLLLMFTIPICVDIHYILKLWLKDVPVYAGIFCQYTLIFNIFANISGCVIIGIHATGQIKRPSIINGTLYLLVIPFSYIAYKMSYPPQTAFIFNIIAVILGALSNTLTLKHQIPDFRILKFINDVFIKSLAIACITLLLIMLVYIHIEESFMRLVMLCAISFSCIGALTFLFIMNKKERDVLLSKLDQVLKRK